MREWQIRLRTIWQTSQVSKLCTMHFKIIKGQEIKDRFIDPRIKFYDAMDLDPVSPRGFR
jgi:hypothetical protein